MKQRFRKLSPSEGGIEYSSLITIAIKSEKLAGSDRGLGSGDLHTTKVCIVECEGF